MGITTALRNALGRANALLSRPNVAVLVGVPDSVQITAPARGEQWTVGESVTVRWRLIGVTGHPMHLTLVTLDGTRTREVAALARGLDPRSLTARVTVPDVPAGTYAVALTSDDPMDIVSPPLTIVADRVR
ncbi:GPI anchored serine-threonine rich family protein [Streptomyces sp. NPDC054956]